MGNNWINIRVGIFHFQADYGSLWAWRIARNPHWRGRWLRSPVAIYDFDLKEGWRRRKDGCAQAQKGGSQ